MISVDRVSAASFIGRAPELAELEAALADARDGRPRLVFLAGESGVGKSRLLSEFRRRAGELGGAGDRRRVDRPRRRRASLRPARRRRPPARARRRPGVRRHPRRRAGPSWRGSPPSSATRPSERGEDREGETQRRLFDALLSLLEQLGTRRRRRLLARGHPLGRPLDALVPRLPRGQPARGAGRSSSRPTAPTSSTAAIRCDRCSASSSAGPCSRRIDLGRFDRDELSQQLADILGGAPRRRPRRPPLRAQRGQRAVHRGAARRRARRPRGAAADACARRCSPGSSGSATTQRATIGLLAVAGRADDSLLAETTGARRRRRCATRFARRSRSTSLRTDDDGRFSFRHALIREVVYDDLLPGERSELHLALAHELEARADGGEDGVWIRTAVAHHFHSRRRAARGAADGAGRRRALGGPQRVRRGLGAARPRARRSGRGSTAPRSSSAATSRRR